MFISFTGRVDAARNMCDHDAGLGRDIRGRASLRRLGSVLLDTNGHFASMGSFCSKPGTVTGGHQVLGSSSSAPTSGSTPSTRPDPRMAAAEAAERRQKEVGAAATDTGKELIPLCCVLRPTLGE